MSKISRDEMMAYGRFGYSPGKFKGCTFCRGTGCPACDDQAQSQFPAFKAREDAEYQRLFPNGPEAVTIPIEKLADAKDAIGADALRAAFGEGGGVKDVFDNLERLGFGRPKPIGKTTGKDQIQQAEVRHER